VDATNLTQEIRDEDQTLQEEVRSVTEHVPERVEHNSRGVKGQHGG
jgi:hypothetical protein